MNTSLALMSLLLLILAVGWGLTRIVRHDRPVTPSRPYQDWREEQLAWRHLGIR